VSESAAVRWVLFHDRKEEGGEPCGRVNIVQNQAEVILSVIDGAEKSTPSRELSTMSASKENMGRYFGPLGAAESLNSADSVCMST
jgi:hypothetical protein